MDEKDWRDLLTEPGDGPSPGPEAQSPASARLQALYPARVNAYFGALIQSADDPLGRQVIPSVAELDDPATADDPLTEERQSPVSRVIHRYPGRVVLLVSDQCAVHCRFCMRKRRVARTHRAAKPRLDRALSYIQRRTDIQEVILSGGDPLMRADADLAALLAELRAMPHVRRLRIHTRIPGVLPQRVTPALVALLAGFHPLYVNIHFNHPAELTPAVATACNRLADAGIPLGSQTVLLKGVNDHPAVLTDLMERLLDLRVRPYYLHLLDRVPGTRHFQVPVERAVSLLAALRGPLSGMGVPHMMVDLPGGGGKVALTPDAVIAKGPQQWHIRNWQGRMYTYP